MKNENDIEKLPEGMADIKSGKIFDIPSDYFEKLSERLFDEESHLIRSSSERFPRIRSLRPWLIAASVALIIALAWWLTPDFSRANDNLVSESELGDYIRTEIMEYDLETLSQNINEEDLYSLSENESKNYEKYIEENLDDFDEIIY